MESKGVTLAAKKNISKGARFYWGGVWFLFGILLAPIGAHATNYSADQFIRNPSALSSFGDLLSSIITYLNAIVDPLVVIMFLWGGFQVLTAGGDESKIKDGKKTITYAAIGAVVIICASGLIYVINQLLGIQTP